MGATNEEHAPTSSDSMFAAITSGAQDRPESRLLDRLVGDWRSRTAWEPIVGHGVRHLEGSLRARWVFGGRVVEASAFDATGTATGKVLFAFDPIIGDYTAYSVTALSTFFVVERGHHDPIADTLVLEAVEPVRGGGPGVRFQRIVGFVDEDTYTTVIAYPDVPVGTYGPMSITYERHA